MLGGAYVEAKTAALESRLRTLHPYDVPEFLIIRVAGGSPEYLSWLSASTIPDQC